METSDNNASSSPAPRRSGRARVAPQKFSPEPHPSQNGQPSSSKRKRGQDNEGGDDDDNDDDDDHDDDENDEIDDDAENEEPCGSDNDVPTDEEHDDDEDVDADADHEPVRRSKKSRPSQKTRSKKPAAKRAKVNGAPRGLAPGPLTVSAVRLPNRAKKTTKVAPAGLARRDENDLYCKKHNKRWYPALAAFMLILF